MRLSLSMIVRDEERTLGRVLDQAAQFCDELVVVDTGSVDATCSVAERAGARVLHFEWVDDFAAARQFSWDACTGEWVLWLDADDVLAPAALAAYRSVKEQLLDDRLDAVWAPYRIQFDPVTGACVFAYNRERLVRRAPGVHWVGAVHEVLVIPGSRQVLREDLYVEHRPDPTRTRAPGRNLAILQRLVAAGDRSPRTLFYLANELRDQHRYAEAVEAYRDYLAAPGSSWESYVARLSLARCLLAVQRLDEAVAALQEAARSEPQRAEAYMALGRIHVDRGEWAAAIPYYTAATAAVRPHEGFVHETDYSWGAWDLLGVCLAHVGRHREAIEATLRSLHAGNPDRERLAANLRWCQAHL